MSILDIIFMISPIIVMMGLYVRLYRNSPIDPDQVGSWFPYLDRNTLEEDGVDLDDVGEIREVLARSDKTHRNFTVENYWLGTVAAELVLLGLTRSWVHAAFVLVLVVFSVSFFQRVPQPQRWVIELAGRYVATWGPGFHFLPFFFTVRNEVTLAVQRIEFFIDGEEHTMSRFNGSVFTVKKSRIDFLDDTAGVNIVAFIRVFNPFDATYRVDPDFVEVLIDRLEGAARSTLSRLKLDDALKVAEGASKLILSFFLNPGADFERWQGIRAQEPYQVETENWVDGTTIPGENPFLSARTAVLPPFAEGVYSLDELGAYFSNDGVVIADYKLSDTTTDTRDELLKANREVRIADRRREADRLEGLGRKQRLEEIRKGLGEGATGEDAVAYDLADKATETLKEAKPTILSGDLTKKVLEGITGWRRRGDEDRSN